MTPAELELVASFTLVQIEPAVRMRIALLAMDVEMEPMRLVSVPLWLAVCLRDRDLCIVKDPDFLTPAGVQRLVEAEQGAMFAELPLHFFETAKLLGKSVGEVRQARRAKARLGARLLGDPFIQMDNLTMSEINELKPAFKRAFIEARRARAVARQSSS